MHFFNIFTSQKSKPPIQITTLKKLSRFFQTFFTVFYRIKFMPVSCIFPSTPDSCQIHAGFSRFQCCHSSILHYVVFMPVSCRFHAYLHLCRIHVRFMPDSVEFTLVVSCASNPVYRISISDPASAATSFFKTLNGGDPALSHS